MGHSKIARELAEQTGANVRDALKFVDDVGQEQASRLVDEAEEALNWKVPATAGVGTAGALAWRQQDVERAQARAEEATSRTKTAKSLIEDSSLSPAEKGALLDQLLNGGQPGSTGSSDSDGSDGDIFGALEDTLGGIGDFIGGDGSGLQQTIVQVIVLLVIISIVTNYASESLLPTPDADVELGGGG